MVSKSKVKVKDILNQKFLIQNDAITGKIKQIIAPTHFRVGIDECDASLAVTGPIYSLCSASTSVIGGDLIVCGTLYGGNLTSSTGTPVSSTWSDVLARGRETRGYNPTLSDGSVILGESGSTGHPAYMIAGETTLSVGDGGPVGISGGRAGSAGGNAGAAIVVGGDASYTVTPLAAGGDVLVRPGVGAGQSATASLLGGDYGQARVFLSNNVVTTYNSLLDTPVVTLLDYRDKGAGPIVSASVYVGASRAEAIDDYTAGPVGSLSNPSIYATGNVGSIRIDVGVYTEDALTSMYGFKRYPGIWIKRTNFISPGANTSGFDDSLDSLDTNRARGHEWWQFVQCRVTGSIVFPTTPSAILTSFRSSFPGIYGAFARLDVSVMGVSISGMPGPPVDTYCRRFRACATNRFFYSSTPATLFFDYIGVPIATGEATGWDASMQVSGDDVIFVVTGSSTYTTIWRMAWAIYGDEAIAGIDMGGGGGGF